MALDAADFYAAAESGLLPLYEAKLFHQFDHRWASYSATGDSLPDSRELSDSEKGDPYRGIRPRYWVKSNAVNGRLEERWNRGWMLGWRKITNVTNERTMVATVIPATGAGDNVLLLFPSGTPRLVATFSANFNVFAFDFTVRQKLGSPNLNYYVVKQLPVLSPNEYLRDSFWQSDTILRDWIADRVLELSYTAWDLQPFAQDLGYDGPPFRWDPERRFEIRCELDAAYFHLYEIERDDVDYIMSTFPIVQRKDEAAHGHYRTRDRILEIYDAMASGEWQSSLDPPVADPRAAHPAES